MSFLDTLHRECSDVHNTSLKLKRLASAFARVGNYEIAEELTIHADNLEHNATALQDSYSQELTNQLTKTRKDTGEVLSLVFERALNEMDQSS